MARYNPNLMGSNAAMQLLPKGDYEFTIGEAKTFQRTSTQVVNGTSVEKEVYGVSYSLRVRGGDLDGKTVPLQFYLHTDGGFGMAKQFIMAACGYPVTAADEARFNEEMAELTFGFDTETSELDNGWKKPVGAIIKAAVDQRPNPKNVEQMNQTFKWRPAV